MHARFKSQNQKIRRYQFEDLGVDGRIILNGSKKQDVRAWARILWRRTGTSGCSL
jgi:hypothetical protein